MNQNFNDIQFSSEKKLGDKSPLSIRAAREYDLTNKKTAADEFEQIQRSMKELEASANSVNAAQGSMVKILEKAAEISEEINTKNVQTEKLYSNMEQILKAMAKVQESTYAKEKEKENVIINSLKRELEKETSIERQKELQDAITKLELERVEAQDDFIAKQNTLIDQASKYAEFQAISKRANEDAAKAMQEQAKGLANEIKNLQVVSSLRSIENAVYGGTSTSNPRIVMNQVRAQLGISGSEYGNLQRSLQDYNFSVGFGSRYGWGDTAQYLSNLGNLGITTAEMAQQQYEAIVQGTKYLGLSTETQAAILKNAKQNGNLNLLQETNENMVKILNAQLGISKEQLNQITNQSASLSTLALGNGTVEFQSQIAAITSKYGQDAGNALYNIVSGMLQGDTSYAAYLGEAGMNYAETINRLQSGDQTVLLDIYEALRNSNYASTQYKYGAYDSSVALNGDLLAIQSAGSNNDKSLYQTLEDIKNSNGDVNSFISEISETLKDKVGNILSNLVTYILPTGWDLSDAFYVAELTSGALQLLELKKQTNLLIEANAKAGLIDPKNFGASTSLGQLIQKISLIAGIVWAINDIIDGSTKKDEWKASSGASAVGGLLGGTDSNGTSRVLKNMGKWALIGAGLGSVIPGLGTVAGAIFGGIAGLAFGGITGAIGGENIAKGLDNLFGTTPEGDGVAPRTVPVLSSSNRGGGGTGEPLGGKNFLYGISSPFGYRNSITGKDGKQNSTFHSGIDLLFPMGTPIGANWGGIVTWSGNNYGGGNGIIIDNGNGVESVYWHMKDQSRFKKGDRVNPGQLIGYSGNTGNYTTGPHLHYGERIAGQTGDSAYFNPINNINSELFYPTDAGTLKTNSTLGTESMDGVNGGKLLTNIISADTLSTEASAVTYGGMGDGESIVTAINNGFAGLREQIDSLSSRQDDQEQMLRAITSGSNNGLYRFS